MKRASQVRRTAQAVFGTAVALALVVSLKAPLVAEGHDRPQSARDVETWTTVIAHDHRYVDEDVKLGPVADSYVPAIAESQALDLAFAQLGPSANPSWAQPYLGTASAGLEKGTPIWVVTYGGVCGAPNLGPQGNAFPACGDDTLSVAIDASTGRFIVAW